MRDTLVKPHRLGKALAGGRGLDTLNRKLDGRLFPVRVCVAALAQVHGE